MRIALEHQNERFTQSVDINAHLTLQRLLAR